MTLHSGLHASVRFRCRESLWRSVSYPSCLYNNLAIVEMFSLSGVLIQLKKPHNLESMGLRNKLFKVPNAQNPIDLAYGLQPVRLYQSAQLIQKPIFQVTEQLP